MHLLAIARRVGVTLNLDDWDTLGRGVHCLVDIMPSGRYLMEDFFEAGGLPVVIRELGERGLLHRDALTVNGKTIWENNSDAPCWNREVIIPFDEPFKADAGIAVLRGNLAPDGAVIKPCAASPELMRHTGRAVVFESIEDLHHASTTTRSISTRRVNAFPTASGRSPSSKIFKVSKSASCRRRSTSIRSTPSAPTQCQSPCRSFTLHWSSVQSMGRRIR